MKQEGHEDGAAATAYQNAQASIAAYFHLFGRIDGALDSVAEHTLVWTVTTHCLAQ